MGRFQVERFGCFGKLPVSREFIVDGGRDLAESGLDRWIGEGIGLAKAHMGSQFDQMVTSFPQSRFAWGGGRGKRVLVGQMNPSTDGAGRKHPFSVFAYLDARKANGVRSLLPAAAGPVFDVIRTLMQETQQAESANDVMEGIQRGVAPEVDEDAGENLYRRFVEETKTDEVWHGFLDRDDDSLRYQVMQAFVETIGPFRGRNPRDIRIGIRFPLSGFDAGRTALEVAFWLDMTERRLKKKLEGATYFWSDESPDRSDLILFFSTPAGGQWSGLVDPNAGIDSISFLDRPYGSRPEARMEPELKRLLDDPEARLEEYLNWARG